MTDMSDAKKLLVGQNVSPEQMSRFGAKELMVLSHAAAWVIFADVIAGIPNLSEPVVVSNDTKAVMLIQHHNDTYVLWFIDLGD